MDKISYGKFQGRKRGARSYGVDDMLGQLGFIRTAPKPREPQRKH